MPLIWPPVRLSAWQRARKPFYCRRMKPVRATLIYFAVVFIGGSLLAPWLYWGAQWGAELFPQFQSLSTKPFHRFVNRSWMLLGLLGLWPYLRCLGIRSWAELGLGRVSDRKWLLSAGFLVGLISLAAVAVPAVMAGARELRDGQLGAEIARRLFGAALTGAVVGVLEEVFFRGALFGGLRKTIVWPVALGMSSAIYALLHFFERPPPPEVIHWASGLALLPRMMRGFGEWEMLVPGFFNLTLAGVILGLAYQRMGSLYFSIGLHAGWIFWLKAYRSLTRESADAAVWFWGSGQLIDGWLGLVVLSLALLVVWRLTSRARPSALGSLVRKP
jgi:uncharacterized protein